MRRRTRRRGSDTVLGEGRKRESEDSREEKCTCKSQINYRLKSMTMSYMHIYLI